MVRSSELAGIQDTTHHSVVTARKLLLGAYLTTAACYFAWRLTVINLDQPAISLAFVAAELVGFLWSLNLIGWTVELMPRDPGAPPAYRSVDVVIPTYNESIEVVRRTLVAATRIRYPHVTWLFDDGNRPAMRELAAELGCRYLTRSSNTHAKAGNLNEGLRQCTGEFVAIFDADHVAHPEFLHRTLGYFRDQKVAFVQTPQEFYNFDSYQHIGADRAEHSWNEHSLFYRVIQRHRDQFNAAMLCGCSAVLRRSALDSIGGFATGTVTEDMHTSVRLHKGGWSSVMHPETLSAGLAPTDAKSFRGQRLRWAQGAMQVMMQEKLYRSSTLGTKQRLCYLLHVLSHFEGFRNAFVYLLPAIVLTFDLSPITAGFGTWAMWTVPYFAVSILMFEETGRGHGRFLRNEVFNLARCTTSIRATLALTGKQINFWVTPKSRSANHAKIGFLFPYVILAMTAAAAVTAAIRVGNGLSAVPPHALAITALWASISAAAAARLCLLTRRCQANQRAVTRFPVEMPIDLTDANGLTQRATIVDASAEGLTLTSANGSLPAGRCMARVWMNGEVFAFGITLRAGSGARAGGPVQWSDAETRDRFDYALHVNRIAFLSKFDAVDANTHLGWLAAVIAPLSAAPAVLRPVYATVSLLIAALVFGPATANAQTLVPVTGVDHSSTSSYAHAGAIRKVGGTFNESGPVVRVWGDRLTYHFDANERAVEASSYGGNASLGYRWASPASSFALYGGVDLRHTGFSIPLDRPNRGLHLGARMQAEGRHRIGDLAVDGIAVFVTGTNEYWTRAGAVRYLSEWISIGPEIVHQGSATYESRRLGLQFNGLPMGGGIRMSINGGVEKNARLRPVPYASFSMVRSFGAS